MVAEGRVTISEPDEDELTEWRLVIDYAKRHGLPRRASASRATGPSARVARSPHPVVVALRDDEGRLAMPSALGRRALLLFQGFVAEAVRRGHGIKDHPVADHHRSRTYTYNGQHFPSRYSRREGELGVLVGGFTYAVTVGPAGVSAIP